VASAGAITSCHTDCRRKEPAPFPVRGLGVVRARRRGYGGRTGHWSRVEEKPSAYQQGRSSHQYSKANLTTPLSLVVTEHIFRRLWADYFDSQGIKYAFFSALGAAVLQEARRQALEEQQRLAEEKAAREQHDSDDEDGSEDEGESDGDETASEQGGARGSSSPPSSSDEMDDEPFFSFDDDPDSADAKDPRTKVLSVLELEDLFKKAAPDLKCSSVHQMV
jgi:hypothetical protein